MATLNLFLETPVAPEVDLPAIRPKTDLMLFFKQFVPAQEHPALQYVGRRLVPKDTKVKVRRYGNDGTRRGLHCFMLLHLASRHRRGELL